MPIIEDPGYDSTPSLSRNLVPDYRAARQQPEALDTLQSLVVNFKNTLAGTFFDKTIPLSWAKFQSNDDPTFDPYKFATNDYFAEKPWMLGPFMDGTMDSVHSPDYFLALEMATEESYRRNERLGVSSWYNTLGTGIVAQGPELIATGVAGKALGLAKYGEQLAEWAGKGGLITKVLKGSAIAGTGNVLYGQAIAAIDPSRSMGDDDVIYNDAALGVMLGGVAVPMIAHGFMKARDRVRTAAGEVVNNVTNERLKQLQVNVANATVQKSYSTATAAKAAHVSDLETLLARGRKAAAESGTATNPSFWWNKQPATNPDFGPSPSPDTNPPFWLDRVAGPTEAASGPVWSYASPDTKPRWSYDTPDTNPAFWLDRPEMPRTVRGTTKGDVNAGPAWSYRTPETGPKWSYDTPDTNPSWSYASKGEPVVKPWDGTGKFEGWKLHLTTGDPEAVSAILSDLGYKHKVGRNAGQAGKDVTVYVGHKDAAVQAAAAINERAGNLLQDAPAGSEALKDDVSFGGKVLGRFDTASGSGFHQYGSKGVPFLESDMDPFNATGTIDERAARATQALEKKYGSTFSGSAPKGVNFDVRDMMPDQVSPDGRIHITLLDTPETRRLQAELKSVYGDQIEFHDHPEQAIYDAKLRLETLDDYKNVALPAEMSWLGKRLQSLYDVASPAARLAKNPDSLLGKLALHTLLDMSGAPKDVLDAFGSASRNVPGEGHKMILDGYLGDYYRSITDIMGEAQKAGGFTYRMSNGETVQFSSRAADREAFGRALWDVIVRENNAERGDKLYLYDAAEVPPHLKQAAQSFRQYMEKIAGYGSESGVLNGKSTDATHIPQVYNVDAVRMNPDDFVEKLYKEARRQRTIDKNAFLNPIEKDVVNFKRKGRELVRDRNGTITDESGNTFREAGLTPEEREKILALVEEKKKAIKLENAQLREAARAAGATSTKLDPVSAWDSIKIEDLREAGVSPERYIEEQDLYDRARAESVRDTLLDPANEHGVADATKRRQIAINRFALREYLADNALDLIDAYAHRMHGRIGAHLAVKRMADDWAPVIKQYTGKDIVKERYSPSLMIDAVQKHFDEVIANHTKAGDTVGAQRYADAQAKTVALLREHLDKLMGTNVAPTTAGTLAWKWTGRQLGRFSTLAFQGTSVVSNLGDMSSLMAMNMLGEGGTKAIGNWIRTFLAGPAHMRRDIENFAAVAMDWTRQAQAIEYGDIPSAIKKHPYGRGKVGAAMTATDKATAGLVNKFYSLNLMRRFTESGRLATVNALYDFVTRGSQALVNADDLIKGGMDRAKALDAVGMSEADAEQLARMGFNIQRARKLLDKIDQHGLDYNGNRIDRNHDGQINLEAHKWASEDRELYDALQFAVNGEALNIVLEPKQGYRLLINDRSPGVRLLNNMSSFVTAFGSQWMPLLARRTGAEKAAWIASTLAISAIADALHNHLSGRRTLSETADEWINNPFGMIYGAINRSPILGWMSRPLGIAESAGVGPGRFLNNNSLSGVYSRPGQTMLDSSLGPAYQLLSNGIGGVEKTARSLLESGELGDGWKQTYKSIPFNNWIGLRALNRLSEAADYGTLIGPAPR